MCHVAALMDPSPALAGAKPTLDLPAPSGPHELLFALT
jgi:hypothetical protein